MEGDAALENPDTPRLCYTPTWQALVQIIGIFGFVSESVYFWL